MRFRAVFALVAAGSAAACFSFGDLSGGGDDSVAPDSATGDGSVGVDGQPGGDSGAKDAALSDSAPTEPFCLNDRDATFCADFDESTDAMAGFSSLYLNDGGLNGLDEQFFSSPHAFFSGNGALASGTSAHAALVRHTGVAPTTDIVLDFDIRIDGLSTQNSVVEALAIVNVSSMRSSLQLNVKGSSSEVGEEVVFPDGGTAYVPHVFSKPLPVGQYAHMHIVMTTSRTLTVVVSGETMLDHVSMIPFFVFAPVDLYLGNAYSPGPSSGATIHYDDVSLTVE